MRHIATINILLLWLAFNLGLARPPLTISSTWAGDLYTYEYERMLIILHYCVSVNNYVIQRQFAINSCRNSAHCNSVTSSIMWSATWSRGESARIDWRSHRSGPTESEGTQVVRNN